MFGITKGELVAHCKEWKYRCDVRKTYLAGGAVPGSAFSVNRSSNPFLMTYASRSIWI